MPISQGLDVRIQLSSIRVNLNGTKSGPGRKLKEQAWHLQWTGRSYPEESAGYPTFTLVIGRAWTKTASNCVQISLWQKSQWNRFEDLETLQSKKCRLLVSLQSGHQKKKLRCTFQVETTLGNQYALWCDKILSLDPWTLALYTTWTLCHSERSTQIFDKGVNSDQNWELTKPWNGVQ